MTGNNQVNYVVFEIEGVSRSLVFAADYIRYDDPERMTERIEVALYAFRTAIDRLHSAHDRLKEALRVLREKECGKEEGKENAESGKDDQ